MVQHTRWTGIPHCLLRPVGCWCGSDWQFALLRVLIKSTAKLLIPRWHYLARLACRYVNLGATNCEGTETQRINSREVFDIRLGLFAKNSTQSSGVGQTYGLVVNFCNFFLLFFFFLLFVRLSPRGLISRVNAGSRAPHRPYQRLFSATGVTLFAAQSVSRRQQG